MNTYEITMIERQADGITREIVQTAVCESRQQVIEFYGLNEPDIESYTIKQITR